MVSKLVSIGVDICVLNFFFFGGGAESTPASLLFGVYVFGTFFTLPGATTAVTKFVYSWFFIVVQSSPGRCYRISMLILSFMKS